MSGYVNFNVSCQRSSYLKIKAKGLGTLNKKQDDKRANKGLELKQGEQVALRK